MASIQWKNSIWDNPILNKWKSKKQQFWKLNVHSLVQKIPLLMASIQFWKNPIWDNPILNKGKSNQKIVFEKINVHSLIKKSFTHSFTHSTTDQLHSDCSTPRQTLFSYLPRRWRPIFRTPSYDNTKRHELDTNPTRARH